MPLQLTIRKLTEHDAQAAWDLRLVALELEPLAFTESAEEHKKTPVEAFTAHLRASSTEQFVLGAFAGDKLMGIARFSREPQLKRRHIAWVQSVFVQPEARGKAAGRALMARILEEARALPGLNILLLKVAVPQSAARKLYSSLGFQSYGVETKSLLVDGYFVGEEYLQLDLSQEDS